MEKLKSPFLWFGALEGKTIEPSRGGRRKKGIRTMCDVLQGVGGRVVVRLGLRLLQIGDSPFPGAHAV